MTPLIGLGAGGHARVLIDILRQSGKYEIAGLLDPGQVGATVDGIAVIGGDEQLGALRDSGIIAAFVGVGDNSLRRRVVRTTVERQVYDRHCGTSGRDVVSVGPTGQGVAVMAGAILNAGALIGDNVVINSGAIVEHDCVIGPHTHIAPGAVLCGGVRVGAGAHIGAGATVRQYLCVGDRAVVGAGAAVVEDVQPDTVVVGVPARPLPRQRERSQPL